MSLLPQGRGRWWFAGAGLLNALGTGSFLAFALPYLAHAGGLPLATVGTGLTVAYLVVLPALPALGRLADVLGVRTLLVGSALLRAAAFAGLQLLDGTLPFLLAAACLALGMRAEQIGSPLLATRLAERSPHGDGELSTWLALSRTVFNTGIGGGAVLSSLLIGAGAGYGAMGAVTAAAFLFAAVLHLPLPAEACGPRAAEQQGGTGAGRGGDAEPRAEAAPSRRGPFRRADFRRVSGAGALFFLAAVALESALPVYLLSLPGLPRWLPGLLLALNTVVLALGQLPMNKRMERYRPGLLLARGAVLAAASIPLFTAASLLSPLAALLATVAAMLGWTLSEMVLLQTASVLLITVAGESRRSSFLAAHQVSVGLASALGPLLVTSLMSVHPLALFGSLAAVCLCAGALNARTRTGPSLPSPQPASPFPSYESSSDPSENGVLKK